MNGMRGQCVMVGEAVLVVESDQDLHCDLDIPKSALLNFTEF